MNSDTKIILTADDGTEAEFFIIDTTKVNDIDYILVCDSADPDEGYYILKDLSSPADEEALYEMVEDETERDAVAQIFEQLLDAEELD